MNKFSCVANELNKKEKQLHEKQKKYTTPATSLTRKRKVVGVSHST